MQFTNKYSTENDYFFMSTILWVFTPPTVPQLAKSLHNLKSIRNAIPAFSLERGAADMKREQ